MDFSTSLTGFKSIPFADEEAGTTTVVDEIHGQARAAIVAPTRGGQAASADSLPDTILSSWSRIARAGMSRRMYDKLVRIAVSRLSAPATGQRALRPASLKNFLQFWSAVRDDATEPELALGPDGTLHAEWYKSERQHLDVRFLDHKVLFGLFASNDILEGAQPREMVALVLRAHPAKPLRWGPAG